MFFTQPRKQRYLRKSGGISIYFKEGISKYLKVVETQSDYALWIEIDKCLMKTDENVILGGVYISPENSNFFNEDEFLVLETEITSFRSNYKYVFLSSDFNARTSQLRDYTEADNFLAKLFDFDDETKELFFPAYKLAPFNLSLNRTSCDQNSNNIGFKLLDICKNNNLFILNGRMGSDKDKGNFTFRHTSVIDYMLASVESLKLLNDFDIIETDPIFSDGHSLLQLSISCTDQLNSKQNTTKRNNKTKIKWYENQAQAFCDSIDLTKINSIISGLESPSFSKNDINLATEQISNIFDDAGAACFPHQSSVHSNPPKPWFGPCCKSARKKYHLARKMYNNHKNSHNRANMIKCSKAYKKNYAQVHRQA